MWLLGVLQKSFPKKFTKKYLCYLNSLSDTIKELQAVRPATLLKRHPRSGVLQPAVCRSSAKQVFLNNPQNSQEKNILFYRTSPVVAPESFSFPTSNFIIKETTAKMFFCEFYKIFKNIFSLTEHLRMTASCVYTS